MPRLNRTPSDRSARLIDSLPDHQPGTEVAILYLIMGWIGWYAIVSAVKRGVIVRCDCRPGWGVLMRQAQRVARRAVSS
jgi:hypothetical protein